jgi:hypothetical protein
VILGPAARGNASSVLGIGFHAPNPERTPGLPVLVSYTSGRLGQAFGSAKPPSFMHPTLREKNVFQNLHFQMLLALL